MLGQEGRVAGSGGEGRGAESEGELRRERSRARRGAELGGWPSRAGRGFERGSE